MSIDDRLRTAIHDTASSWDPDPWVGRTGISRRRERQRRQRRLSAIAVSATAAVVAVAALLATHPWLNTSPPPVINDPNPPSTVSGLHGIWSVGGVGGSSALTLTLIADPDQGRFREQLRCGRVSGSWDATPGGAFAANIDRIDPSCAGRDAVSSQSQWIEQVSSYRPDEAGWSMLDEDGREVASLAPLGATGEPGTHELAPLSDALRILIDWPTVDNEMGPTSRRSLVGTFVAAHDRRAQVTFSPDGSYQVFDSCGIARGRWAMDRDGGVAVTVPPGRTDCATIMSWFSAAHGISFGLGHFHLLDAAGDSAHVLDRTR